MIIELKDLFDAPGASIPFNGEVDLSNVEVWGARPFTAPVRVSGLLRNRSGVVSMEYSAEYVMEYECDRCRRPVRRESEKKFSHWLAKKLEGENENEEYILVPGSSVNMDELVMADVTLELPFRLLCREDCKGLCPICGADLNEADCGCSTKQTDPRLESLKKLLES